MEFKKFYRVRFQVFSETARRVKNAGGFTVNRERKNEYVIELVVSANESQAAVMDAAYRAYRELNSRYQIEMISCEDITAEVYR